MALAWGPELTARAVTRCPADSECSFVDDVEPRFVGIGPNDRRVGGLLSCGTLFDLFEAFPAVDWTGLDWTQLGWLADFGAVLASFEW